MRLRSRGIGDVLDMLFNHEATIIVWPLERIYNYNVNVPQHVCCISHDRFHQGPREF